jgi:hypothetical protein
MKSPFPGMGPYIEQCNLWGDFHFSLILRIKEALAKELSERYFVRTARREYTMYIGAAGETDHPIYPPGPRYGGRRPHAPESR